MKSSVKHVEDQRGKGCFDRISSLPDDLLVHVVSFLPTRCAVRTSILSRRWRYIFTLTSCLSFDDSPWFRSRWGHRPNFSKFVYKVLELKQISPIKKFSLVCEATHDESDLNTWVNNVVQKGVQEIHYEVVDQEHVPDGLIMCETLVTLKLISRGRYNIKLPLSIWLPNLKILHLGYVKFVHYDSMERLLSACKLLEELTLECCCVSYESYISDHVVISAGLLKVLTIEDCNFEKGLFEIDAPNLAYLTYRGSSGMKIVPSWKHSCSLVKAKLKFKYCTKASLEYNCEILKAVAYKTTELSLLSNSIQVLHMLGDQEQMHDFHSLTKLHLGYFSYDSWIYVTRLLDKSPQLETVIFKEGLHRCFFDPASPECEPIFRFSCHAQVIEVCSFCGHKGSLLHLGHLLKHARVLKKLIIHKCSYHTLMDKLQISKDDLLILPRVSPDCCIELKECHPI